MLLSVLDQTPVSEGSSGPEALQNTLDLARAADALGYHRYWLAEHHGLSLAGPSPEVLIGPVAAATERIRVGSGGPASPDGSRSWGRPWSNRTSTSVEGIGRA